MIRTEASGGNGKGLHAFSMARHEEALAAKEAESAINTLDDRIDKRQYAIKNAKQFKALIDCGAWTRVLGFILSDYRALKKRFMAIDPKEFEVAQARARVGYDTALMMVQSVKNLDKLQAQQAKDVARRESLGERFGRE